MRLGLLILGVAIFTCTAVAAASGGAKWTVEIKRVDGTNEAGEKTQDAKLLFSAKADRGHQLDVLVREASCETKTRPAKRMQKRALILVDCKCEMGPGHREISLMQAKGEAKLMTRSIEEGDGLHVSAWKAVGNGTALEGCF